MSNNVSRRQAERWQRDAEQQAPPQQYAEPAPVAAAPAPAADPIEQLQKLGEMKMQGLLTEEEFAAQKAKLLG